MRWNYYKLRQLSLLQSAIDGCYKLRQLFYYKVRHGILQIATGITKCDGFITNCNRYYKVRWLLQIATVQRLFIRQITALMIVSVCKRKNWSRIAIVTEGDIAFMVKIQKRPAKVVRIKQTVMRIDNKDFKQTLRKYLVRWREVILSCQAVKHASSRKF